ncbi:hypothetical protein [Geotalea sp. SG265]|uniref:hypothetical protein n=1 Tax=Geotalea sp. SG265 TaxID=2922867 RepID=UPI001FAF1C9E|nr:hypothetical protein [Geotalea sp. SG265]
MEFINFLKDMAIPTLVSSGLAIIILKFLSNKLINQLMQKEFEEYKTQLQEKTTLLKTSLSIYAEEQNIANQRIDNQKANAIHQIYSGVVQVARPISRIIAGSHFVSDNKETHINFYNDWAEKGHSASCELASLLVNHAIYFDESTYKQISDFSSVSAFAIADFLKILRQSIAEGVCSDDLLEQIEHGRLTIEKIHANELKNMQYKLTSKFRSLLGIEKTIH